MFCSIHVPKTYSDQTRKLLTNHIGQQMAANIHDETSLTFMTCPLLHNGSSHLAAGLYGTGPSAAMLRERHLNAPRVIILGHVVQPWSASLPETFKNELEELRANHPDALLALYVRFSDFTMSLEERAKLADTAISAGANLVYAEKPHALVDQFNRICGLRDIKPHRALKALISAQLQNKLPSPTVSPEFVLVDKNEPITLGDLTIQRKAAGVKGRPYLHAKATVTGSDGIAVPKLDKQHMALYLWALAAYKNSYLTPAECLRIIHMGTMEIDAPAPDHMPVVKSFAVHKVKLHTIFEPLALGPIQNLYGAGYFVRDDDFRLPDAQTAQPQPQALSVTAP